MLCSVFYFATVALNGAPALGDAANTAKLSFQKRRLFAAFSALIALLRLSELVLLCVFIYLIICLLFYVY